MTTPKPTFRGRLLVLGGLVVAGAAALVLVTRYGFHRLVQKRRNRH
jgi:hypothetical protein